MIYHHQLKTESKNLVFFIDFHIISTKSVRFSKAELQKKVTDETAVWSLKLSD